MIRRKALKKKWNIAFHNVHEMVQDINRKTITYLLPVILTLAVVLTKEHVNG